ncbi:MAG TPA: CBS domain-containing protein, partial [Gammaproteobacteria bacterium]|nr:CBS domain-containing protein [Gammaproteobacteria bacterium]
MVKLYQALQSSKIFKESILSQPKHTYVSSVELSDPAVEVMTDFRQIVPITIESDATLRLANEKMIAQGVRLLFVVDYENRVDGIITANDLLGERPVQYIREHGGVHDDILVYDIMTRKEAFDAVQMQDVARYKVGDIVETIKNSGRHHVLVIEDLDDYASIRGVFSISQLSRQIGEKIEF